MDAEDTTDVAALKLKNFKVRTIGVRRKGKIVGVVGQSDFSNMVVAMGRNPSPATNGASTIARIFSTAPLTRASPRLRPI